MAGRRAPELPDVYHYFEQGASLKEWSLEGTLGDGQTGLSLNTDSMLVSRTPFEGDFTAEYNITSISEGGQARRRAAPDGKSRSDYGCLPQYSHDKGTARRLPYADLGRCRSP